MAIINQYEERLIKSGFRPAYHGSGFPLQAFGGAATDPERPRFRPEPQLEYARELIPTSTRKPQASQETEPISRGRYLELWRDDEDNHGRPYNRKCMGKRAHKARKHWARHLRHNQGEFCRTA